MNLFDFSSWRDSLRPASFRGVSFFVLSHDVTAGRITVTHQYPGRDDPHVEDLGKASRKFSVDGYLVGDSYMSARDAIMDAFEKPGAGILIHPYLGRITVVLVEPAKITETTADGRMCAISMTFVKSSLTMKPIAANDGATGLLSASGSSLNAASAFFAKVFTVAGRATAVVESAREKVGAAISAINAVKAQARKLADFKRSVGNLIADVNILMLKPSDLANSILSIVSFNFGGGTLTDPFNFSAKIDDLKELSRVFDFGNNDPVITGFSSSIDQINANRTALNVFVQSAATIYASRCIADIQFSSYEEAMGSQDVVVSKIDLLAESITDDAMYLEFQKLRTALVENIKIRSADLSRLQSYTPWQAVPSLVLSHRLYGSIAGESDILARNKIRNPMTVPGGSALEVLNA